MQYRYKTKGVCSRQITVMLNDAGIVTDVEIEGGCNGNLQGIACLVKGQKAPDVIEKLRGIRCEKRATSCPDQLAIALEQALAMKNDCND